MFILPTSHICLKTMKSFELNQRWHQARTKLSEIMNISYHWILKSGLLKWLQLLCFFTLPSLLKEINSGPSSDSSLSCCKRSLVSARSQHLLPCLEKIIFISLMQHNTWAISVLGYDMQENKSSRSAPDSKPSVTTAAGNNWQIIFGHTLHLTHDWNPQLAHKIAKSNVLRHIKAPSLSVTSFKVNPLFLLCWSTTAKCSRTCPSSNAFVFLL